MLCSATNLNLVFESRNVPYPWYQVICVKNKGNPANADNYRGITILS